MKKYLLITLFLLTFIFAGYYNLDLSKQQNSLLAIPDNQEVSPPPALISPFELLQEVTLPKYPRGAVIDASNEEKLSEFFKYFDNPGNFIILASREQQDIGSHILNFKHALKKHHPLSKIRVIYYSEISEYQVIYNRMLEEVRSRDVVIALATFSSGMNQNIAEFHSHLTENVFNTFDLDALDRIDSTETFGLKLLMNFLNGENIKSAQIWDFQTNENYTSFFVNFYRGHPATQDRDLTILAFGDMMLGRYVRILMEKHGMDYIFAGLNGNGNRFFKGADIVFANLEGPILGQGSKGGTSMVFSFNRDIAPLLKKQGFDLLSIANNHTFDKGTAGFNETIDVLTQNNLGWCGDYHGPKSEAVYYGNVSGKKYAFICVQDVTVRLDIDKTIALIKEVRPHVDYLILSPHWGNEYQNQPHQQKQIDPAHKFIDAGVDLIIGHHPHVAQTIEIYNGRYIFYSLGNFIFDQYFSVNTQQGLAIGVVLGKDQDNNLTTKVYYFPLKSVNSQPTLMPEGTPGWLPEYLNKLSLNQ